MEQDIKMKVLNVEHRDVHIEMDFSLKEIIYLRDLLSYVNIEYNSEQEPEVAERVSFLNDSLYPMLQGMIQNFYPNDSSGE